MRSVRPARRVRILPEPSVSNVANSISVLQTPSVAGIARNMVSSGLFRLRTIRPNHTQLPEEDLRPKVHNAVNDPPNPRAEHQSLEKFASNTNPTAEVRTIFFFATHNTHLLDICLIATSPGQKNHRRSSPGALKWSETQRQSSGYSKTQYFCFDYGDHTTPPQTPADPPLGKWT